MTDPKAPPVKSTNIIDSRTGTDKVPGIGRPIRHIPVAVVARYLLLRQLYVLHLLLQRLLAVSGLFGWVRGVRVQTAAAAGEAARGWWVREAVLGVLVTGLLGLVRLLGWREWGWGGKSGLVGFCGGGGG